jgi:omega-amidase
MSTLKIGLSSTADLLTRGAAGPEPASIDLLVFPELVDGGYAALKRGGGLHRRGDCLWDALREASRRLSCCVVGGSMVLEDRRRAGRFVNSSPVFAHGRLIHHYEKIHLFTPGGDDRFFERGRRVATFSFQAQSARVKAGLILCYDLRFPELARAMALRGIQLLVVPARWPAARDHAWKTLLQARAIENQIFVVGCNSSDREGGTSYVVDPLGEVVYASREPGASALECVRVDLHEIAHAHSLHRNLRDAVFLRNSRLPALLPDPRVRKHGRARGRSTGRSRPSRPS